MFIPTDTNDPPPVSLSKIDCARETIANFDLLRQDKIDDVWTGDRDTDHRELPEPWTGQAEFLHNDRKTFADLHEEASGRKIRQQATQRPPWCTPGIWSSSSRKQRKQMTARWDDTLQARRARESLYLPQLTFF